MIDNVTHLTLKNGRKFADKGVKAPGLPHRITIRNAAHIGLFFYVQGQLKVVQNLSIMLCIESYAAAFMPDVDTRALQREYYRMLHEYLNDSKIFNGYSDQERESKAF